MREEGLGRAFCNSTMGTFARGVTTVTAQMDIVNEKTGGGVLI